MKTLLSIALVSVLIAGCSDDDGRSTTGASNPPPPVLPPLPGVAMENINSAGQYLPVVLSPADIDYMEIGVSAHAVCAVVFTGALTPEGLHKYEAQCATRPDPALLDAFCDYDAALPAGERVSCGETKGWLGILLDAAGPSRLLTDEETELHHAVANASLCYARRRDGSQPPIECAPV